jgi:tRNA-splicing ligase RtcB
MKLSVFDVPASEMKKLDQALVNALQRETMFGAGKTFKRPHDHAVMECDWACSPITKRALEKARGQLGTSGSGNHFVEFGVFTIDKPDLGLQPGEYLALLSHSGSRGAGAMVADHYSKARPLAPLRTPARAQLPRVAGPR